MGSSTKAYGLVNNVQDQQISSCPSSRWRLASAYLGDLTNIGEDQKNHNVYKVNVHLSRGTRKQKPSIFDKYVRIPTGKTQLLDLVFESTPNFKSDGIENETKEPPVRQAVHVIRIACERNRGFLRVSYTGPGAQQAFKRDFFEVFPYQTLTSSSRRSLEVAQLYGYSNSEVLPALIFYDVPVNTIRSHHKYSALLDLYMSSRWRCMMDSSEQGPQIMQTFDFTRELWIQPRSGGLCIGPLGPDGYPHIMYPRANSVVNGPTLPMELYEDVNLLQYHGRYLSDREFLLALSILSLELNPFLPGTEADLLRLPSSIYSIARNQTIATCPRFHMSWYLAPQDSRQSMEQWC
uniref:Uncharacterized protein n=1 Tax=Moniliophthora roreri TaxID=221103 RepID=A0A0W0FPI3_MONRR